MTLEQLAHIFRHQTQASEDYTPSGQLEYIIVEGNTRTTKQGNEDSLQTVLESLIGYEFEGYRDRTPYFVKPEVHIAL